MADFRERLAAFLARLLRPLDRLLAFLFPNPDSEAGPSAKAGASESLCDRCKYCYGDACSRPERPNATRCPDFKAKAA